MSIEAMNNVALIAAYLRSDELKSLIEQLTPIFLGPDVKASYVAVEALVVISNELYRRS